MNEPLIRTEAQTTALPLIEMRDICKTYVTGGDMAVQVLHGVSLAIYPGEFLALMGASGSGKSTLMNILGCLDRPTSGQYFFAGRDVSALGPDALAWLRREAFGFIFQSYNLIANATALENVEVPAIYAGVPPTLRHERATAILERLGLADRMTHRPTQLSGGQQQRVSIGRSLMNGGRIILADEPTGALDSRTGAEVMAYLKSLADEGHTVIVITHDAAVAAHARRRITIHDGIITADTGPDPQAVATPLPDLAGMDAESNGGRALFAGMREAAEMALRALRANIFRTVLTLLGIVIGVGSVVAMLAVGEGAKQAVVEQIGSMGTNLLRVFPDFRNQRSVGGSIAALSAADAEAIGAIPGVKFALPELTQSVTARFGNIDDQTQVDATAPSFPDAREWPIAEGVFFSDVDAKSYAAVAVLGSSVAQTLFPDGASPLGQYVLVKNIPFQVVGVMSSKGASANGQDQDDIVFIPLSTGLLRIAGKNASLRNITIAADSVDVLGALQDEVTQLLTARHGTADFRIRNMAEAIATVTEAQNTMTVLLGSVAAISLLVGGIGVMNIMLVSVTERTREIGIRMATGARQRDILEQFLTEAMVVSCLGGLVGILGGIVVGLIIEAFGTPIGFTLPPILLAFGCAAATGLVFGYAPAHQAARLDPVVALASD
jgi:macrolide transport system ATP-binding/permease protein